MVQRIDGNEPIRQPWDVMPPKEDSPVRHQGRKLASLTRHEPRQREEMIDILQHPDGTIIAKGLRAPFKGFHAQETDAETAWGPGGLVETCRRRIAAMEEWVLSTDLPNNGGLPQGKIAAFLPGDPDQKEALAKFLGNKKIVSPVGRRKKGARRNETRGRSLAGYQSPKLPDPVPIAFMAHRNSTGAFSLVPADPKTWDLHPSGPELQGDSLPELMERGLLFTDKIRAELEGVNQSELSKPRERRKPGMELVKSSLRTESGEIYQQYYEADPKSPSAEPQLLFNVIAEHNPCMPPFYSVEAVATGLRLLLSDPGSIVGKSSFEQVMKNGNSRGKMAKFFRASRNIQLELQALGWEWLNDKPKKQLEQGDVIGHMTSKDGTKYEVRAEKRLVAKGGVRGDTTYKVLKTLSSGEEIEIPLRAYGVNAHFALKACAIELQKDSGGLVQIKEIELAREGETIAQFYLPGGKLAYDIVLGNETYGANSTTPVGRMPGLQFGLPHGHYIRMHDYENAKMGLCQARMNREMLDFEITERLKMEAEMAEAGWVWKTDKAHGQHKPGDLIGECHYKDQHYYVLYEGPTPNQEHGAACQYRFYGKEGADLEPYSHPMKYYMQELPEAVYKGMYAALRGVKEDANLEKAKQFEAKTLQELCVVDKGSELQIPASDWKWLIDKPWGEIEEGEFIATMNDVDDKDRPHSIHMHKHSPTSVRYEINFPRHGVKGLKALRRKGVVVELEDLGRTVQSLINQFYKRVGMPVV
jgi:hypothetical protein